MKHSLKIIIGLKTNEINKSQLLKYSKVNNQI